MKYDIGFFQSPDRGLDCLVELIPQIEKKLGRKLKSVWAYGWNVFDAVHEGNTERAKWKWELTVNMQQVGMENKGRLEHKELAKLLQNTKVWAYPTEFTEIFCITALKVQQAGCIPVTTDIYALEEVVKDKRFSAKGKNVYTNKKLQEQFVDNVVKALKAEPLEYEAPTWADIAKEWDKVMS